MSPNKKTARFAGLLFLLMIVFGMGAEIFFRQKLFASNDVTVTANSILSNIFLYRAGITSDILMALSYLLTALALYKLLCSVNKNLAAVMVIFTAAGSVLLMFNILNETAPLYILNGNDYLSTFNPSQRQSLAMLFYNLYQHGYMIGQIFFALWVLPLGVLIYKSRFIHKIFGVLFVIETIFGLIAVMVHFLMPNATLETIMMLPMMIAEFPFMLYLLIRGIDESKLLK
ncbi:MAG TPA: DUF4386 domain-containing protein [Patescibacteria group bacterium]|nr:DUF4386 domain-containing protein [Patescibacteria group bacterium]